MIPKLNIVSTFAALVLFFLPWIDIQCSNRTMATQSGVQTIYGGSTISKELDGFPENGKMKNTSSNKDESMGVSILVGVAFTAVIAAFCAALLVFRGMQGVSSHTVGILCAAALVAISLQLMIGFPVRGKLSESMAEPAKSQFATDPFAGAGASMAAAMIQVRHLPSLYLELLALGIPTLIAANGMLDKFKKTEKAEDA